MLNQVQHDEKRERVRSRPIADIKSYRHTAPMQEIGARFRAGLVSALAFGGVAVSVGFYLLPPSNDGRMSRVLRTEDGFTATGLVVFSILCGFSLITLFSAIRSWLGLPAISSDDGVLKEYVFPFRRMPISEIERIEVRFDGVDLHMKSGRKRTINARLIKDHETFFDRIILD